MKLSMAAVLWCSILAQFIEKLLPNKLNFDKAHKFREQKRQEKFIIVKFQILVQEYSM